MFKIDEITKYDEKTNQILDLIDREEYLFTSDMLEHEEELERNINKS